MSDTASPPVVGGNSAGARGSEFAIFAAIGAVVIGLLWLLSGDEDPHLQKSATGFDGLVSLLRAEDVEARSFSGGGRLVRGNVALRVLPIFDTDLDTPRERPGSREEVIGQTSENDLSRWLVQRKARLLPTMVVLPKWRTGMRRLGVAHFALLIPPQEINRVVGQITSMPAPRVRRDPAGFTTRRYWGAFGDEHELGLMHLQVLRGIDCKPIIGTSDAMLLAECPLEIVRYNESENEKSEDDAVDGKPADDSVDFHSLGDELLAGRDEDGDYTSFLLLADPDLLNNHGLRHASNADMAVEIARQFDPDLPVILDKTNFIFTVDEDWEARRHERTWEDFARMFRWPFTMIWIAFFFLGALVLWRAVTRYGPLARSYDDEPRASKEISIAAKARLLRLANHDAALLSSHVKARLHHLAAELLGPHRPVDQDPLAVLTRLVGRRSPELAEELRAASDVPDTFNPSPAEVIRRLDRFENCYDKVTHEFGRTSEPR